MDWRHLLPCLTCMFDIAMGDVNDGTDACLPPTGLQLSDRQYNSVKLRWNYNRYQTTALHCICMGAGPSVKDYCSAKGNVPSTCTKSYSSYEKSLTSLSVYSNYTACVQRQCGPNISSPSCLRFTTTPLAPSAPYQLFVDRHSPSSLDVSWRYPTAASGPLDGYRVRWCLVRKCVYSEQHVDNPTVRSYRITGLPGYDQYLVAVSAYNVDRGRHLYSGESTVNQYTLPTYPSEPSGAFTKVSPTQMDIQIHTPRYPNGPISGYEISWCPVSRCYGANVAQRELLQSSPPRQAVTGLSAWQNYTFSIRAFNTLPDNTRAYSPATRNTISTWPITPSSPPNLQATPVSSTAVKLTWEIPLETDLPLSHFRIATCIVSDRHCVYTDVGSVRETTVDQLKPWTLYMFLVHSLLSFGGRWVPGHASSANTTTLPAEPSKPSYLQEVQRQATKLDVSWREPLHPQGPIVGYKVRLCPYQGVCPPTGLISRYRVLGKNSKNVSFYGLQPYTKYQVQVKALNALEDGSLLEGDMAVLDVHTEPTGPSEPVDLRVQATGSSSLRVTWRHPRRLNGPVLGYRVTWWEATGNESYHVDDNSRNESATVTSTHYNITGLKPYTTYAVEVIGINRDGRKILKGAPAHAEGRTRPVPPLPPSSLTALKQFKNGSSTVNTSWDAPNITLVPAIDGYLVVLCRISNVPSGNCVGKNASKDEFTVVYENVQNFAEYVVTVRAYVVHDGIIVEGEPAFATLETDPPPLPLLKPRILGVGCCSANISWDEYSGSPGHKVYYSLFAATEHKNATIDVDTTSLSLAPLGPWEWHQLSLRVCITNDLNRTACGPSATASFQTLPAAPSPPLDLQVTESGTRYGLSWRPPAYPNGPLDGYVVSWYSPPERTSPNATFSIPNALNNSVPLSGIPVEAPFLAKLSAFNNAEGTDKLVSLPSNITFVPEYEEHYSPPPVIN